MKKTGPWVLGKELYFPGGIYAESHSFQNGHTVPVYEVFSTSALNQIIGQCKFINADYGNVYYRGISGIYDNVLPTLMRGRRSGVPCDLLDTIKMVTTHESLRRSLKLLDTIKPKRRDDYKTNKRILRHNNYIVEAVLQHYVGNTRMLDIVDNHWIALWMGLHNFIPFGKHKLHRLIEERRMDGRCSCPSHPGSEKSQLNASGSIPYVFILLLSIPHLDCVPFRGIYESKDYVLTDLRLALPSIYLRPHAQHALVVMRRPQETSDHSDASYYDLANEVVGILKVRIDVAKEMLGNGTLLNSANLFPSPGFDQGYNNLLMNSELFKNYFRIIKYF